MTDDPKNKKTQPQPKPKTVFVTSQYSNYKDSNYTIESRPGVKTDITIATGDAKDSKEIKNVTIIQSSLNDITRAEGTNITIDQGGGNDLLQFGPDEITDGGSVAGKYVSKNAKVNQGAGDDALQLLDDNGGVTAGVFDGGKGIDNLQLTCPDAKKMTITRTQDGFIIKNNAEKLAKIYEGYYKSNSNTFKNYEKIECIAMSGNVILDEKELAALPIGKAVSVAEADLSNAAKTPSAKPPKTPGKSL